MAPIPVQSSNVAFRTRRLRRRWPWHAFWLFCSLVFSTMALTLLCASSEVDRQRALLNVEKQNATALNNGVCDDPAAQPQARRQRVRAETHLAPLDAGVVAHLRDVLLAAIAPHDLRATEQRVKRARRGPAPCPVLAMTDPVIDCAEASSHSACALWGRCAADPACPAHDVALRSLRKNERLTRLAIDAVLDEASLWAEDNDFLRLSRRTQDERWDEQLQRVVPMLAAETALPHLVQRLDTLQPMRLRGLLRALRLGMLDAVDDETGHVACDEALALSFDEQADFSKPVEILFGAFRGARAPTLAAEKAKRVYQRCEADGHTIEVKTCGDIEKLERAAPEVAPLMSLRMTLHCDVAGALRVLRSTHDVD